MSKQESQFFTLDTLFDFSPPWVFLFATPCIYESEDPDVFDSKSFDVHVSPDNKQMIIAVKGLKLHAFVVNLENRAAAIQHHVMSDEDRRLDFDDIWYQKEGKLMLLSKGNRLSCVDENHVNAYGVPNMYYRNVIIEKQEEMHVHYVDHDYTDTHLPSGYDFETSSKLVESVKDGKSIWLYTSDGKFVTSMKEMRLNKYGYLDFHEHIPPSFASVTIMATGFVKKEHLAELKPIINF